MDSLGSPLHIAICTQNFLRMQRCLRSKYAREQCVLDERDSRAFFPHLVLDFISP